MIMSFVGSLDGCLIQSRVGPIVFHEFIMRPKLRDLAVIQHEDLVCTASSRQSVRDEDDRLPPVTARDPLDFFENTGLRMGVQGRCLALA
jgi:hypothetical protein